MPTALPRNPIQVDQAHESHLRKNDPEWYFALWWTIVWVIQRLCPFSMADSHNRNVRSWLHANTECTDPSKLHHKNIRRHVVELYKAAVQGLCRRLQGAKNRPLPAFSLQLDLWTSKISNQKFIGK
jgi:hypothetical protein